MKSFLTPLCALLLTSAVGCDEPAIPTSRLTQPAATGWQTSDPDPPLRTNDASSADAVRLTESLDRLTDEMNQSRVWQQEQRRQRILDDAILGPVDSFHRAADAYDGIGQ